MIDSSGKKLPATYATYLSHAYVKLEEGPGPEKGGVAVAAHQGSVAAIDTGWRHAAVNDNGRVIGQFHHSAKLSDDDIELILELRDAGLSYGQIASKFDDAVRITRQTVYDVCSGRRRRQTVMGHKRVSKRPDFMPADPDEFDIVGGF